MENDVIKIRIDRIEENLIIAFSASGKRFAFENCYSDINEGDICNAVISNDGEVLSVVPDKKATFIKKEGLRARLKRLFSK